MPVDEPKQAAGARILVVEDDELNLKLLVDVLEYHGYDIVVATTARAAVDIARRQQPDLILLDIRLPDFPGTQVAQQLKADPQTRSIPIIAVTAFAMPSDRADVLASGCDEYVSKPINLADFLTLLSRYVDGPTRELS